MHNNEFGNHTRRRCASAASLFLSLALAFLACVDSDPLGDASVKAGHAVKDRLLVTMRTHSDDEKASSVGPSSSSVFALSTVLGIQSATTVSNTSPVLVLKLEKNADIDRVIKDVSSMDSVLYAEPDMWVEQSSAAANDQLRPNDDLYSDFLYGMEKIEMPKAWAKYGTGSRDIVVCVIDSGCVCPHKNVITSSGRRPF